MVGGQLPFLVRVGIGKTEIKRGLAPIEIAHELAVALAVALDELSGKLLWRINPVGFRPHVIISVFVLLLLLRCHKPRVVDGRIADHVVENDAKTTPMSLLKELPGIVVGAVARSYLVVVAYVVAGIVEG